MVSCQLLCTLPFEFYHMHSIHGKTLSPGSGLGAAEGCQTLPHLHKVQIACKVTSYLVTMPKGVELISFHFTSRVTTSRYMGRLPPLLLLLPRWQPFPLRLLPLQRC